MTIGFTAKVEGLKELEELFNEIDPKKQKRIMNKALRAGGDVFKAAIIERAPERVDTGSGGDSLPPGALKADITTRVGTDDEGLPAAIVKPGKYTWHVAMWIEYGWDLVRGGWSRVKSNGKRRGPGRVIKHIEADPFLRPAYEASREAAVAAFAETFGAEIDKVKK
jgi:HK97 gp10 family phage protein